MATGIYKLVFKDGTFYVGKALDLGKRYKEHCRDLLRGTHFNYKVQKAYDKNGIPDYSVILECLPTELNDFERKYIDLNNTQQLNILEGSDKLYGQKAPRFIYSDDEMLAIFLTIAENPKVSRKLLADDYGVNISTVYDISAGRGRAIMFKEEYSEEYSKIIKNKSYNTRGKNTVKVTNGTDIVELKTGEYQKFCESNGLHSSNLSKVINGSRKSTGGWRLVINE